MPASTEPTVKPADREAAVNDARDELLRAASRWRAYDRNESAHWSMKSIVATIDRLARAVDRYEEVSRGGRR